MVIGHQKGRAVSTLHAAVVAGNMSLARRQLGELRDEADHTAALDALAQTAAKGSGLAIELLVEALDRFGTVRSRVQELLVDAVAVDEVTQDTLVSVARSLAGPDGLGAGGGGTGGAAGGFSGWLQQVAAARAESHRRRTRDENGTGGVGGVSGVGSVSGVSGVSGVGGVGGVGDPEPGTAAWVRTVVATSPAARQLLGELPERYRDAVLLHDAERLPVEEIVTRLGRSPKAVHSHVARGRALLAARLVRHDEA